MSEPASPNDFGFFDWIAFTSPDGVQSLFRQRMRMLECSDAAC